MTKSEQARADAMADAETLEATARLLARFYPTYDDILDADCTVWLDRPHRITQHAHAAFRAVPGLRGN